MEEQGPLSFKVVRTFAQLHCLHPLLKGSVSAACLAALLSADARWLTTCGRCCAHWPSAITLGFCIETSNQGECTARQRAWCCA